MDTVRIIAGGPAETTPPTGATNDRVPAADDRLRAQMFSEAMVFAKETIRWAIAINGGAAAGLVTFLPVAKHAGIALDLLTPSLIWFGWGVVLGAASSGLSYIAQIYISEKWERTPGHMRRFNMFRSLAALVCMASFAVFLGGLYSASLNLP